MRRGDIIGVFVLGCDPIYRTGKGMGDEVGLEDMDLVDVVYELKEAKAVITNVGGKSYSIDVLFGDPMLFDKRKSIGRDEIGVYCRNRIYYDMENKNEIMKMLFDKEDKKVRRAWNEWKMRRKDFERIKRVKVGV